jgi:integrase
LERLTSWLTGLLTTGVAARRGYGEDSIYWHAAKGRYVGAVSLGYDPKGRRVRKSVTGTTKAEVRDKLKELHRELDEGTTGSPTYRVRQAVAAWLDNLDLDPSTVANYRFMAKHVINGLGNRRLRDLTAKEVQEFLEELPLSTRSRKLVHKVLRDSIQHAMIAGMVGRNVAAVVNSTPRGSAGRPSKALSVAQAEAVLKAAKGTRLEAYLALSLMTGIRTEEARALTWEHVDLDGDPAAKPSVPPHVAVWRSVRAHGDTKTERSKRTLALPGFVADALREHRARQTAERLRAGSRWKEHDLVFASTIGTPRSAGNVRRDFQAICEKAGLGKEWSPRELRHSFVSMLSADGVATEDISHLVGHSSTRTTERVYRHELRPVLRTGAERMSRIFNQRS